MAVLHAGHIPKGNTIGASGENNSRTYRAALTAEVLFFHEPVVADLPFPQQKDLRPVCGNTALSIMS